MTNLLEWTNNNLVTKKIHPLLTIAIFVMEFLEIYPFQTGNSRLSRILTNLLLLKSGYNHCLYSSLEKIIENNKNLYYQSLFSWQKIPDNHNIKFDGWILFFLECLRQQKESLEKKFKNEKLLQNKLDNLHLQVMEILGSNNLLSISQIQALSGANRNTLKVKLRDLVKLQKISSSGKGKGMVYNINAAS
jgi:Fic family protein